MNRGRNSSASGRAQRGKRLIRERLTLARVLLTCGHEAAHSYDDERRKVYCYACAVKRERAAARALAKAARAVVTAYKDAQDDCFYVWGGCEAADLAEALNEYERES